MTISVYIPLNESTNDLNPALLYLSGLTCTDENVCQKSGIFQYLSEHKIALIAPDTSPRLPKEQNLPGELDSWDFGAGAGFYLDATEDPWSEYYRMYTYILSELPVIVGQQFPTIDFKRYLMYSQQIF